MKEQETANNDPSDDVELTVVIPSRDAAHVLGAQLEALAAQDTDVCWEVVVSDNGSRDDTKQVALGFADRLDVRVVDSSSRPGRSFACNQGARAARGRSICFLDADDEVAPGYISAMAAALRAHPFVVASVDVSVNTGWSASVRAPFQVDGPLDVFGYLPFGIGCTLGARREVLDAVGGLSDEIRYDEDVDFCWRVQQAGFGLAFVPEAVVRYRFRDGLWPLFAQTYNYGTGQVLLYRRHRHAGMPRRTTGMVVHEVERLLKLLVSIRTRADLAHWLHAAGYPVGRFVASVRFRTLYL